jgi:hypothetical protein
LEEKETLKYPASHGLDQETPIQLVQAIMQWISIGRLVKVFYGG